jgi:hypothetical protein
MVPPIVLSYNFRRCWSLRIVIGPYAEPIFSSVLPSSPSFYPARQIIELNELPFGGELPFGNFGLSGRSPPHCHTTRGVVLAVPEIGNIILAESEVSHYLLPTSESKHVQTVLDTDLLSQTHSLLADYFRSAPQTAEQYRTEKLYTKTSHVLICSI